MVSFINFISFQTLPTTRRLLLWFAVSLAISLIFFQEFWASLGTMLSIDWIFGQYQASSWGVLGLCGIWLYLKRKEIWGGISQRAKVKNKNSKLNFAFGTLNFTLGLGLVAGAILMPSSRDYLVFQVLLASLGVFVIFFGQAARIPTILLGIYGFAISFPLIIERFAELPYSMGAIKPVMWILNSLGYSLQNQGQLLQFTSLSGEPISVAIPAACAGPATMGVFLAIFALMMMDIPLPPRKAVWMFLFGAAGTWLQSIIRLAILMVVGYYWGEGALLTAHFWTTYILFPLWYLLFVYIYFRQAGALHRIKGIGEVGGQIGQAFNAWKSKLVVKDRMKGFVPIATLFILLAVLFALASPSPVRGNPAIILEPSFETVANWTYSETDNDIAGAQSSAWSSGLAGTNSYLISIAGKNIVTGGYGQILQSVNFSLIDTISFDVYLQADTTGEFEARMLVGAAQVWSQAVPTTATEYLHREVDVSSYTGAQDLIFQIVDLVGAKSATISCYFDNIRQWGSYSDSGHTTVSNDFVSAGDIAYMQGENIAVATGTYKVAYYDGGTLNDGADGAKVGTDVSFTYATVPELPTDGVLTSQVRPSDYDGTGASYGTWNAVIYKTTGSMPASYDLVNTGDAAYIITDSFYVQPDCIPEFSTVITAIGVAGLCFGIYFWTRKRYRSQMVLD